MTPPRMSLVQPCPVLKVADERGNMAVCHWCYQLPVMTDITVVGMLSREDVVTYLRTVQEVTA